jgi:hypothetical protein
MPQSRGPWDKLQLVSGGIRKGSGQAGSLSYPAALIIAPETEALRRKMSATCSIETSGGTMDGALETDAGDRAAVVGEAVRETVTGRRGEQAHRGAMCARESAEHLEGGIGQRHVAVFFAVAVDVQQHSVSVDSGDVEVGRWILARPGNCIS